jgi:hypothetical protein
MNKYEKLTIPNQSSWSKRSWKYYAPVWLIKIVEGLRNLIDWFPIIWQDRHWDDYYITKILQRKIELQREHLITHNRHVDIDRDNFWMTVVLNLLEKEHEGFYEMEYTDYCKDRFKFFERELKIEHVWENLDAYLEMYPSSVRAVKKARPNLTDKYQLSLLVASHRQKKCRNLLFEILKQKSNHWWD